MDPVNSASRCAAIASCYVHAAWAKQTGRFVLKGGLGHVRGPVLTKLLLPVPVVQSLESENALAGSRSLERFGSFFDSCGVRSWSAKAPM